ADGDGQRRGARSVRPLDRRSHLAHQGGNRGRSETPAPHRHRTWPRLRLRARAGRRAMNWRALRGSLFAKIYLTLLASLAAVAIASMIFVRIGQDEQETGSHDRRDALVAAMIPADTDITTLKATLARLADALDGDLAVYG